MGKSKLEGNLISQTSPVPKVEVPEIPSLGRPRVCVIANHSHVSGLRPAAGEVSCVQRSRERQDLLVFPRAFVVRMTAEISECNSSTILPPYIPFLAESNLELQKERSWEISLLNTLTFVLLNHLSRAVSLIFCHSTGSLRFF